MSIISKIHRTSTIEQLSPKIVLHKVVVRIMFMVDVVEITLVSVVMDIQVASSAAKRFTL